MTRSYILYFYRKVLSKSMTYSNIHQYSEENTLYIPITLHHEGDNCVKQADSNNHNSGSLLQQWPAIVTVCLQFSDGC